LCGESSNRCTPQAGAWTSPRHLSGTHAIQTAHQAAQEKYDAVFAIGGDGTVGQVASGLVNTETALAVLPAGTTNVWAIEQGQKPFSWWQWWNLRENARLLANVEPQYVDVGVCNDRPFLLWAGIGLGCANHPQDRAASAILQAHVRAAFLRHHRHGKPPSGTGWTCASMPTANWSKVTTSWQSPTTSAITRAACRCFHLNALLDDGEMDLWLLSGDSLADTFRHFFELVSGRHLNSEYARRIPFHTARIESDANFSIQVDGDPVLGGNTAEISVQHRALKVLMPENALYLLQNPKR
jgi:diacylglycerol kinase (ATP)